MREWWSTGGGPGPPLASLLRKCNLQSKFRRRKERKELLGVGVQSDAGKGLACPHCTPAPWMGSGQHRALAVRGPILPTCSGSGPPWACTGTGQGLSKPSRKAIQAHSWGRTMGLGECQVLLGFCPVHERLGATCWLGVKVHLCQDRLVKTNGRSEAHRDRHRGGKNSRGFGPQWLQTRKFYC